MSVSCRLLLCHQARGTIRRTTISLLPLHGYDQTTYRRDNSIELDVFDKNLVLTIDTDTQTQAESKRIRMDKCLIFAHVQHGTAINPIKHQ